MGLDDTFLKFEEIDLRFPTQLVIETTAACNLRCIMCPHKSMSRRKGNMDLRLYMKIVKEVAAIAPNCEVWVTFMGEALLLKNTILGMIQYAKEVGLKRVVLNSNATYLNSAAIDGLIESGLDRFLVSLDAVTEKTYNLIRPGGNFEASVRGTEEILRRVISEKHLRPTVTVQMSVMDENEHEQEEFKRYWSERGAIVKFRPKCSWAGSIEAQNLSTDQTQRPPCRWAMETTAIHYNGDVVTCVVDYEGFYKAGNIWQRSLQDIWLTELKALRYLQYKKNFSELPDFCARCLDWQTASPIVISSDRQVMMPRN
jgi:radical SAM protein with 4Fe4S-binding SPASM domain